MLKPSHFRTPRSMDECKFVEGYTTEPAARASGEGAAWWTVVLVIALAGTLVVIACGPGVA